MAGQQTDATNQAYRTTLGIPYSWWRSFKEVEDQSPGAAEILKYCTMLDTTAISIEIIENIPSLNLRGTQLMSRMRPLFDFFLLHRNNDTLSVEPHIKRYFQYWLVNDTKITLSNNIIQALHKTLEDTSIPNMHSERARIYEKQFTICKKLIHKYNLEQWKTADLYDSYGHYLIARAEYEEGEKLLDESWHMQKQWSLQLQAEGRINQHRNELDLKKARNRNYKSELCYLQGNYTKAKFLLETEVLPIYKRLLGENTVELATMYYHLARLAYVLDIKHDFNDYLGKADLMYTKLQMYEKLQNQSLPAKTTITLLKQKGALSSMQANLAKPKRQDSTTSTQVNPDQSSKDFYEKSIKYYEKAIETAKKAIQDTQIQGLEKQALRIEIEICETRKGRCYVALKQEEQGNKIDAKCKEPDVSCKELEELYKELEELDKELRRTYRENFATQPHPEIAQLYLNLAELYEVQHKDSQAEIYYYRAKDIYEELQPDHPSLARTYMQIAGTHQRQLAGTHQRQRDYSLGMVQMNLTV
jgi:primosomal protein N''